LDSNHSHVSKALVHVPNYPGMSAYWGHTSTQSCKTPADGTHSQPCTFAINGQVVL